MRDVEKVAQALWDHHQGTYGGQMNNDLIFGKEWRDKIVPWSHVIRPGDAMCIADKFRSMARAAIGAMDDD